MPAAIDNSALDNSAFSSIQHRLLRAALLRRLILWLLILAPWILLRSAPALLIYSILAILDFVFIQRKISSSWLGWINAEVPQMEDSSALLLHAETSVAQLQRQRLLHRIGQVLDTSAVDRIERQHMRLPKFWSAVLIAVSTLLALTLWFTASKVTQSATADKTNAALIAAPAKLHMFITPPGYTGVKAFDTEAKELQVPEHSEVRWCLSTPSATPESQIQNIELSNGESLKFTDSCAHAVATESIFWSWDGSRTTLKVLIDQAPTISITKPGELIQILSPETKFASIALTIRDDYRISNASLHLTLARGSGENIRFSDKEIAIPQSNDPAVRQWEKQFSLAELGMETGDELYFFVRATDNAALHPHISISPTYTLRLPAALVETEATSVLPILVKPESLRSQRQIIIDTEQLISDINTNRKMSPALVRSRSEEIAAAQGSLRRRYGKFLGEESSLFEDKSDDEHGDHENHQQEGRQVDMTAQYAHIHDQAENATLFDDATKKILRRVLSSMWDAEKNLRAITPQPALPFENRALEAIKQLQQADRIYVHKTAFTPPTIKEEKRMTGDILGSKNVRRQQGDAEEIVPVEIRELLMALQTDQTMPALPAGWAKTARSWIAQHMNNEEQRLAAQGAVQDVLDGCVPCKANLRAWIRAGIKEAPIVLQAQTQGKTAQSSAFELAWKTAHASKPEQTR